MAGGTSKLGPGLVSFPPNEPAKKPIPRLAKTCQIAAWWLPL